MKTLIVSLSALMAVSGAALASDRGIDPRDSDTYVGKYSSKMESSAAASSALAVVKAGKAKPTAFQRMNMLEAEGRGGKSRHSDAPAKS